MRKFILLANLLIITQLAFSQSILAGSETFDKQRKDGFYMTMNIDEKYVSKDWSTYISKFGGVQNKRDDYTIAAANMPTVSNEPVIFMSKITGQKNKTTVFCSFDLGGGNMVSQNTTGFDGAQKIMQDFYTIEMANEDVRLAQADLDAAQSTYEKTAKAGDKLKRNIETNAKDKDKLLKKLDDNKLELDQLIKDQAANQADQNNAKITLDEKRKSLDVVRTKLPKL